MVNLFYDLIDLIHDLIYKLIYKLIYDLIDLKLIKMIKFRIILIILIAVKIIIFVNCFKKEIKIGILSSDQKNITDAISLAIDHINKYVVQMI